MKKIYFMGYLLLGLLFISAIKSFPYDQDTLIQSALQRMMISTIPFYENLSTCSKYELTTDNGINYNIFGLENGKCHFSIGSKHCYFPSNVYKEASLKTIKFYKEKIEQTNNNQAINLSTELQGSYGQYWDQLTNQYCKIEVGY